MFTHGGLLSFISSTECTREIFQASRGSLRFPEFRFDMRNVQSKSPNRSQAAWPMMLDLVAGLAAAASLVAFLYAWLEIPLGWVSASIAAYLVLAVTVYGFWTAGRFRRDDFGWANRVTLARAVLVATLGGVLVAPEIVQQQGLVLASLALTAIVLDGLDGWLARAVDGATRFGARFDMEIDALLILVLSINVVLADRAGIWVLAIGGMRYAFILSGQMLPWLKGELPASIWRKVVCVAQGIVLAAALLPWLPVVLVQSALALSLAALIHSFGRDTLWLWRHRAVEHR